MSSPSVNKTEIAEHNTYNLQQIQLNGDKPQAGWIKEWALMLHGTKDAPYVGLPVRDPHSKLAIVKKAHEDRKKA